MTGVAELNFGVLRSSRPIPSIAFLLVANLLLAYAGEKDGTSARADAMSEFAKADVDSDGQVNQSEFLDWWIQRKQVHVEDFIDIHGINDPKGEEIPGDFRESIKQTEATTLSFWEAFVNSLAMIIVTELGDKTFFIAAILSMRYSQILTFGGAMSALALMTLIGVVVGFALPKLLPRVYTHYASTVLFVYFGIKLLKDGCELVAKGQGLGPSEELDEVEQSLQDKKQDRETPDESGGSPRSGRLSIKSIFWQALTLTFVAEWGDRSQIATIALAAAKDPIGVILGGVLGHSLCTGLACIGGKVIAGRISERNVLIIGGVLFLLFAAHSLVAGP